MLEVRVKPLEGGSLHAALIGKIDEHFDGQAILTAATAATQVVLQLDGIRSISSLGIRALERFMLALGGRQIFLDEISPALANQLAMIPNLLGSAQVRSAKLPFVCPSCGRELQHAIPYERGAAERHAPTCSACRAKMEFDGFSEEYLPH
jgi:hypothetical protein